MLGTHVPNTGKKAQQDIRHACFTKMARTIQENGIETNLFHL